MENMAEIIVVNNGDQPVEGQYGHLRNFKVVTKKDGAGKTINLGWEGGLELGLKHAEAPFVVFQNDDTFLPPSSEAFYAKLMAPFTHRDVGIVSPVTTVASGLQSIFYPGSPINPMEASYLIFFCVMVRREYLDQVGGVDTTLPGGDDFDLSIRMRKAGKMLLINPSAFIIHHGFKTGTRVHGDGYAGVKNGWNSQEMIERTQRAIIIKHGFRSWLETVRGLQYGSAKINYYEDDKEGQVVRGLLNGEKTVLELGCGEKKTVPHAIGVDRIEKGKRVPYYDWISAADVVADVAEDLPFPENHADAILARHLIEHMVDPIGAVKNWGRCLKPGGKLIIATPNEDLVRSLTLDPSHVHVFTKDSLKNLMETLGFKTIYLEDTGNLISMVGCFEKNGVSHA